MISRSIFCVAILGILATTAPNRADARAVVVGDSYTIAFDQAVAGHNHLTATIDILITSFTSSAIGLSLTVKNTDSETGQNIRLTAFGWKTTGGATGGSETSSTYNLRLNQTFPSHSAVNTCFSSGSTCAGGGSGGLGILQEQAFNVTLTGNWGITPAADFSLFAAKFQTKFGSYEPDGAVRVTEPSTLAVFLFGFIAVGAVTRKFHSTRISARAENIVPPP